MSHNCDAIIIACIDFRFQTFIDDFIKKNLSGKKYDRVGWAGSTKDLPGAINQIEISKRLHCINRAIIIHHENCGAYGDASTLQKHVLELRKAKKEILAKFPDLTVDLYYLRLDGKFEPIKS